MKEKQSKLKIYLPAAASFVVLFIFWWILTGTETVPKFILPSPFDVIKALYSEFLPLAVNLAVTFTEAVSGLLIGIIFGTILGYFMDRFGIIYRMFYPILIISQTIPSIALAPLLILWMGFGMAPKITLVAITSLFPIAINLLEGFKSIDIDQVSLMRSFGANTNQIYRYVKFPYSMTSFFAGLKIASSYSVVSAVIAEWLGGFDGLGVYMTRVKKAYALDKMFAVIIVIVALSLLLVGVSKLLENIVLRKGKIK